MKHKNLLIVFLLQLSILSVFGQKSISGKVLSGDDDLSLPGASVVIKGTTLGTVTDLNGEFSLELPEGKTSLEVSFIGYLVEDIEVGDQTFINCVLIPNLTQLEEVIAIGYGTAKKGTITGAIAKVDQKRLESRSVSRVEQALSGQMAGVRVRANTGDLGAPLAISIRGKSSVSASNEPLYVVDGFPTSDISDLVTSDIASINVLKDAASSAIYGSRGTNGVVIIETKSGKDGKAKFSFNAYYGLQTLEKKIDLLGPEEWIDINKEVIDKEWVNRDEDGSLGYSANDPQDYRLAELGGFNRRYMYDPKWEYGTDSLDYIDWQDETFQVAPIQEYQLTASGGNDKVLYHISGTFLQQDGIIRNSDYTRINFRSNLKVKFNEKFSLDMNISPTISSNNGGRITGKDAAAHYALMIAPITDKGIGIETGVYPNPTYEWAGSTVSPVAYLRELTYKEEGLRSRTNVALNYTIVKGLSARFSGGLDNNSTKLHRYIPTNVSNKNTSEEEGAKTSAMLTTKRDNKYLGEFVLNYNETFGNHHVDAIAGYSVEARTRDESFQKNNQFNNDKLTTFSEETSSPQNSYYKVWQERMLSYFVRGQYNYANRYLFSASARRDGSSRFGEENLWGLFPSMSLGWHLGNEAFMQNINFLSSLKFRYSIGKNGNNTINEYLSYGSLGANNYSFGNSVEYGLTTSSLENSDLGWEETTSANYAFDLGLFKNRVFVSFDYYTKKTSGMLYYVPVAATTGFSNGWQNIGSMENQGYEFELTTKNITGTFSWETFFNFSRNTNKITSLGPDNTPVPAGFQERTQVLQVGEPMFSYLMYDNIGVYKDQADVDNSPSMTATIPGDVKYRDADQNDSINVFDRTIVGNPEPDYFWGLTNVFTYKNISLSILLQGQIGGEIYGIIGRAIDNNGGDALANRAGHWTERWVSEDEPGNGSVPRIDGTTSGYYDSRWLYDATYWKIKNVTLTYNLPNNLIKGLTGASVYFSGDNLFMVDKYVIGFSPEAENNEGGDYGGYPLAKVFTLGCRISF